MSAAFVVIPSSTWAQVRAALIARDHAAELMKRAGRGGTRVRPSSTTEPIRVGVGLGWVS